MAMNTPYYLNDIKTIEVSKIREIPLRGAASFLTSVYYLLIINRMACRDAPLQKYRAVQ